MIGRNEFNGLGAATKVRYEILPGGTPHFEFVLNLNRTWRDNSDRLKEETCSIRCECFSKIAEVCDKNVDNGTIVMIDGYLRNIETGISVFVTRFWPLMNRKPLPRDERNEYDETYEYANVDAEKTIR